MDGGESRGARVSVSNRDSKESDVGVFRWRSIDCYERANRDREDVGVFGSDGGSDGFCREEDVADFSGGADERVSGADDDAGV